MPPAARSTRAERRHPEHATPTVAEWVWPALIVLATFAAYAPAIRGGFVWDDDYYVSNNKNVTEPGGVVRSWLHLKANPQYYPLVFTSFWIEHQIWGLHTTGYHVVNLLLHTAGAIVLGRLLTRLRIPGAWLAAALFALHPVQVETAAWITERKNTLSGLFYLLSLTCYVRFSGLDQDEEPAVRRVEPYIAAMLCFLGALLSKTVTASLPAVILLVIWWRRGRVGRRDLAALAPMFVLGIAFGLMTAYMEHEHVGAKGEEWNLTLLERCLLAGRAVWFYAGKLLWPYPITFVYTRWKIDAGAAWQYAFPAAAIGLVVVLWAFRGRIGRWPLVAALCFGGTLFPAIGFLNVFPHRYSFVADHFQYLAAIYILVPAAALLAHASRRWPGRALAAMGLAALMGALSWQQAHAYQSMEALWRDTVAKNDGAWMAHGNLGDCLSSQDRFKEAIPCYERSLQLRPESEQIHYNLALALQQADRRAEAMTHYREAVRIVPTYPEPQVNIGAMLLDEGKLDEALPWLRRAVELKPELAPAHYVLANLLARKNQVEEARRHYAEAVRLKPDYWEAWVNDANLLWASNRLDEAIARYREALQKNPQILEARVNLGSALMQKGQAADGIRTLQEAVKLYPKSAEARMRLGQALIAAGRRDEARMELETARRLQPGNAEIKQLLDGLLANPTP